MDRVELKDGSPSGQLHIVTNERIWPSCVTSPTATLHVREFETGATRDTDNGKHDPEGFLSPLVIERFNEYMHQNRFQKDGTLRDSDNWQKGLPNSAYMKSMWRHFHDVWLHYRGYGQKAKEPKQFALCGLLFNVMGMLHEDLKDQLKLAGQPGPAPSETSGPSLQTEPR